MFNVKYYDIMLMYGVLKYKKTTDENTPDKKTHNVAKEITYSKLEIMAADLCMAYMNHLKNPYSFKLRSAWGFSMGTDYSFEIKYTAENGFGGTVTETISTTCPISNST